MAQVFLSHKAEDASSALKVKSYLARCLVSSWIDLEQTHGGGDLNGRILEGIASCRYFLAFLSRRYVGSDWCMRELEEAELHARSGGLLIIPVLLEPREELGLGDLPRDRAVRLASVLGRCAEVGFDHGDAERSARELAVAIGRHNGIRFEPIAVKAVDGEEVQSVEFTITSDSGDLLPEALGEWDFNVERDFLARQDGEAEAKPLRAGKPVAISGQGPGWLYSSLAVPFKNLCSVYVFNNPLGAYVCIYDVARPPRSLGSILRTR